MGRSSHWRIGSVPYLNARPLLHTIGRGIETDVPGRLSERFRAGGLDVALLPIYEALCLEKAVLADDIAIASRGEVFSVYLATRKPIEELDALALDPASRTSSHLLQCLLAEFYEVEPRICDRPEEEEQARLLIGDPAIRFRRAAADGWTFVDLGAEWLRFTGLPFVFACWLFRPGFAEATEAAEFLRRAKQDGLAKVSAIAEESDDPEFARRYLGGWIRYDLRDDEKAAIRLFSALLRKHGLAETSRETELRFV